MRHCQSKKKNILLAKTSLEISEAVVETMNAGHTLGHSKVYVLQVSDSKTSRTVKSRKPIPLVRTQLATLT